MATTAQQSEVDTRNRPGGHPSSAGDPGNGYQSEDARRIMDKQRTERERQRQSLGLQRENILSQKTSNPGRRAALEAALEQIEGQIQAMG
jgi:hypothetical protein